MTRAAAMVLALVLGYAGITKLRHIESAVRGFTALGVARAHVTTRIVAVVEVVTAVGLLWAPRTAGPFAVVLLSAFSVVMLRALSRGVTVACGCFGPSDEPLSAVDLVRNLFFVGAALAACTAGGFPSIAELILVTSSGAIVWVVLSLVRLRRVVGPLWTVRVPETARWSD
jgi:hypothetical protein